MGLAVTVSEFKLLCQCDGIVIAQSVQAMLETEGIPVRIDGEQQHSMFGGIGLAELRIMVPADRLEEAQRLIDEFDESEPAEDGARPVAQQPSEDPVARRDESDDEMPPRLSPFMQQTARKFSWPILAIFACIRLARGDYIGAGFLFVFAALSWGFFAPDDDKAK